MSLEKKKDITPRLLQHELAGVRKMLEQRKYSPELPLLRLTELNKKLWGIHRRKMTLISARTSNCKSAMAINIAVDLALQEKRVLFLSLEMYKEDVIERIFCLAKNVNNLELLHGNFENYTTEFSEFTKMFENKKLIITDMLGKTWQELDGYIRQVDPKPDIIIIDHIHEVAGAQGSKDIIDEYLRRMREMAIRDNFALIICAQANRSASQEKNYEPQLHNIKGSGYFEEGSDIIILLHWPYFYDSTKDKNEFKLIVAKNRNGRTGSIELKYTPECYLFEDKKQLSTDNLTKVNWNA